MIPFARPFLPARQEYERYLSGIWERGWLTNDGELVRELEQKLKDYLQQDHLFFVANGTLALQFAIRSLAGGGEVITTPFSYVATASAVFWEGCKPVFADISAADYNLDPATIEACISPETKAILATHVYGNPCDTDAIQDLADRHRLKVIYDAAHCFGTTYKARSVFAYGDAAICSLHATKLFHTAEGGIVCTPHATVAKDVFYMRNFGHDGPERFAQPGINGKNSELHAAMGLANFVHLQSILEDRKRIWNYYRDALAGTTLKLLKLRDAGGFNHAYFPVAFSSEAALLAAKAKLEAADIQPRRYFSPALSAITFLKQKKQTPVADHAAATVLCLPMYHGMQPGEMALVCSLLV